MATYSIIDHHHTGHLDLVASYYRSGRSPASRLIASVPGGHGPRLAEALTKASTMMWASVWCGGPLANRSDLPGFLRSSDGSDLGPTLKRAFRTVMEVVEGSDLGIDYETSVAIKEEWDAEVMAALAALEWALLPGDEEPLVGDRLEQWLDPGCLVGSESGSWSLSPAILLAQRAPLIGSVYWRRLSRFATAFHSMHKKGRLVAAPPLGIDKEATRLWCISPSGHRGGSFLFGHTGVLPCFAVFSTHGNVPVGHLVDLDTQDGLPLMMSSLAHNGRPSMIGGFVPIMDGAPQSMGDSYPGPGALTAVSSNSTARRAEEALLRSSDNRPLTYSDILHLGAAAAGAVHLGAEWTGLAPREFLAELDAVTEIDLRLAQRFAELMDGSSYGELAAGALDLLAEADPGDAVYMFQLVLLGFTTHLERFVRTESLVAFLCQQPYGVTTEEERQDALSFLSARLIRLACSLNGLDLDEYLAEPHAIALDPVETV